MGTALNVEAWSKTAASNDGADSSIGTVADSSAPTSVDNWVRGIMASVANYIDDIGGGLTAAGTANAHTVTTNRAISSGHLTDGLRLAYYAPAANTSTTVTVAVDGLTAKNIKRCDGSALTVGCIKSDMLLDLVYEAGVGEFRAANIEPLKAAFSAHKNGSNQSIGSTSATKVTFGTELFDDGGYFDAATNYRWTPPAGRHWIGARAATTGLSDLVSLNLYKNGSLFRKLDSRETGTSENPDLAGSTIVDASGTDYYEIFVDSASDSTYSVVGSATETWFEGHAL